MTHTKAIEMLHREGCSCVIIRGDEVTICRQRGVKDLFVLLSDRPDVLEGAFIADKVVGKGAAGLMVAGRVEGLYADVISLPALRQLGAHGIPVGYGDCVPNIINRSGTGICPVETLCADTDDPAECVARIGRFLTEKTDKN